MVFKWLLWVISGKRAILKKGYMVFLSVHFILYMKIWVSDLCLLTKGPHPTEWVSWRAIFHVQLMCDDGGVVLNVDDWVGVDGSGIYVMCSLDVHRFMRACFDVLCFIFPKGPFSDLCSTSTCFNLKQQNLISYKYAHDTQIYRTNLVFLLTKFLWTQRRMMNLRAQRQFLTFRTTTLTQIYIHIAKSCHNSKTQWHNDSSKRDFTISRQTNKVQNIGHGG